MYDTARTGLVIAFTLDPAVRKCCATVEHIPSVWEQLTMNGNKNKWFILACGTAAAAAVAGFIFLIVPGPTAATPQFAAATKKDCGDCHTNAKGGGALTALGEQFKADGIGSEKS